MTIRMPLKFKSRLGQLIAQMEGYGKPGTLPTRLNNPGDLRHGTHATHDPRTPESIGTYASPELGEIDLEHQLSLYASRGMTVASVIYIYAPPSENDSKGYLDYVCQDLPCTPSTLVSEVLQIPALEG